MKKQLNRKYKDRVFCIVFQEKESLLELYNAVSKTDYKNPDELEIHTLEDVIYLGIKNDKSFLIGDVLNLYEHQSTWSPNLPLRGLFYFAELYQNYLKRSKRNLYSNSHIELPFPQFVVFYNGISEREERQILRLSDHFPSMEGQSPAVECVATVLNINWGKNRELMEKCRKLQDYSRFISVIREKLSEGWDVEAAVRFAVGFCVEHEILSDILIQHGGEIMNSILTDYNEEEYRKMLREEYRQEGHEKGRAEGREEGRMQAIERLNQLNRLLAEASRTEDIIRAASNLEYQNQLFQEYGL